jgi:CheY-like chemotaxis protein
MQMQPGSARHIKRRNGIEGQLVLFTTTVKAPFPSQNAVKIMAISGNFPSRCLILIVEDNPIVRRIAQLHMRRYAIDVHTAVDGIEAVEANHLHNYDLILMDVQLPRMNGLEAARTIREEEKKAGKKRVPIIAVAASTLRSSCIEAGMDDYVDKPADYDRIVRTWLPNRLESIAI